MHWNWYEINGIWLYCGWTMEFDYPKTDQYSCGRWLRSVLDEQLIALPGTKFYWEYRDNSLDFDQMECPSERSAGTVWACKTTIRIASGKIIEFTVVKPNAPILQPWPTRYINRNHFIAQSHLSYLFISFIICETNSPCRTRPFQCTLQWTLYPLISGLMNDFCLFHNLSHLLNNSHIKHEFILIKWRLLYKTICLNFPYMVFKCSYIDTRWWC